MNESGGYTPRDDHDRMEGAGAGALAGLTVIGILAAIAFGVGLYAGMAVGERDAMLLQAERQAAECRR